MCGDPGPPVAIDVSRLVPVTECLAIADARDPTWSPIALVEAIRIRDTPTIAGSDLHAPIALTVQSPDVLPVLRVSELEQLVLDAGDAMPCGGVLQVTVDATSAAIVLTVGDTGGEHHTTRSLEVVPPSRGRALGLDIARRVVLRHGGALHSGARDDGGMIVTVSLPLDRHG